MRTFDNNEKKKKSAAGAVSQSTNALQGKAMATAAATSEGIKIPSLGGSAMPPAYGNGIKMPSLGGSAMPVQRQVASVTQRKINYGCSINPDWNWDYYPGWGHYSPIHDGYTLAMDQPAKDQPAMDRPNSIIAIRDGLQSRRRVENSMIPNELVEQMVQGRADFAGFNTALTALLDLLMTDSSLYEQQVRILQAEDGLFQTLETAFITSTETSSLDLLPDDSGDEYRDFAWQRNDYPGGPQGRNEGRANRMTRALSGIRPERRANSTANAVVTRQEFERSLRFQNWIAAELRGIPAFAGAAPGQTTVPTQAAGHRLNQHAQAAFLRMRAAALADGVPLAIVSSYRTPQRAQANAAASGNPAAVASFSSHSLGLAFDLRMSLGTQTFAETTTRPMQNVVDMRKSPVHKWIFLHGAEYGFFPYQNEPWHWEYNPDGFREQLWREYRAPAAEE